MDRSGRLFSEAVTFEASTNARRPEDERENLVDALDILEASQELNIPSAFLSHLGNPTSADYQQASAIGGGLTSQIIFHYPGHETAGIVDENVAIAIKMFDYREPEDAPTTTRALESKVYAAILREIKAFGNLSLKGHENIANFHFIAWHRSQEFPMLAMELGLYGTLDYLLRSQGGHDSVLPNQSKEHIMLDIAAGLQAIHNAGIVHGDLKPENIIIVPCRTDDTREMVAKLLDFGGSTQLSGGSYTRPLHFTPLWCAPEVLGQGEDRDIDWQKCDMYSYGLIVASLWGRSAVDELYGARGLNSHLRSSVVSSLVPAINDQEGFMEELRMMQSMPDNHPGSLIGRLRQRLQAKIASTSMDASAVLEIILSTLCLDHRLRPTALELLERLWPMIEGLGRKTTAKWRIVIEPDLVEGDDSGESWGSEEVSPQRHETGPGGNKAREQGVDGLHQDEDDQKPRSLGAPQMQDCVLKWSTSWAFGMNQSGWGGIDMQYLTMIYRRNLPLFRDITSIADYIRAFGAEDIPSPLPPNLSPAEFLEILRETVTRLASRTCPDTRDCVPCPRCLKRGRTALYLATANCLGWGKPRNASWAVKWLSVSSLLGNPIAISLCPFAVSGSPLERFMPSRLYLCLLALTGLSAAIDHLALHYPDLLSMVRRVRSERPGACKPAAEPTEDDFFYSTISRFEASPATRSADDDLSSLQLAMITADIGMAEDILYASTKSRNRGQNLPDDFLHELCDSSFSDTEAAMLVPLAHEAGAKLDLMGPVESQYLRIERQDAPALQKAILRGRPKLASALLSLHLGSKIPIPDYPTTISMSFQNFDLQMLDKLLHVLQTEPSLCHHESQQWSSYQEALTFILDKIDEAHHLSHLPRLERLGTHGEGLELARQRSISSILAHGALPTLSSDGVLDQALRHNDIHDLQLLVEHLRVSGVDVLAMFSEGYKGKSMDKSVHWVGRSSVNCFEYLVKNVLPISQCTEQTLSHIGHSDVYEDKYGLFVRILLNYGADPIYGVGGRTTALHFVLIVTDLVTADAIADKCSEAQLATLLSHDSDDESSLFWYLLQPPAGRYPSPLVSLQWIADRGGAHYQTKKGVPVWHTMMARKRPTSRAHQLRDLQLISYLLDLFPIEADTMRCSGCHRGLIHFAAENGHVEIVRLLVQKGYDVNMFAGDGYMETINKRNKYGSMVVVFQGIEAVQLDEKTGEEDADFTALDMAWLTLRCGNIPIEVQNGGFLEVMQWRTSIAEIVYLLIGAGVKSRALYQERQWAVTAALPERNIELTEGGPLDVFRNGRAFYGVWPLDVPSRRPEEDALSSSSQDSVPVAAKLELQSESTQRTVHEIGRNILIMFWGAGKDNGDRLGMVPLPASAPASGALKLRMPRWTRCDYAEGSTGPLHIAAAMNDAKSLTVLLQSGIGTKEANMQDEMGLTPLLVAVELGNIAAVQVLAQGGADLGARDAAGRDPLHRSVWHKPSLSMAECLMSLGADVNSIFLPGPWMSSTPLTLCLTSGDHPEMIQTLIDHGACINTDGDPLQTPWFLAFLLERWESLCTLLSAGSDVSWQAPEGEGIMVDAFYLHYIAGASPGPLGKVIQTVLDTVNSGPGPFFWHVETLNEPDFHIDLAVTSNKYKKDNPKPQPETQTPLQEAEEVRSHPAAQDEVDREADADEATADGGMLGDATRARERDNSTPSTTNQDIEELESARNPVRRLGTPNRLVPENNTPPQEMECLHAERHDVAVVVGDEGTATRFQRAEIPHVVFLGAHQGVYLESEPIPSDLKTPISKVHICITGRDQGWSDHVSRHPSDRDTFSGSETWFNLSIKRDDAIFKEMTITKNVLNTEDWTTYDVIWDADSDLPHNETEYLQSVQPDKIREFVKDIRRGDRLCITLHARMMNSIFQHAFAQTPCSKYTRPDLSRNLAPGGYAKLQEIDGSYASDYGTLTQDHSPGDARFWEKQQ
ncbi:hypothetical protein ACHAPT_002180 [Fusarium lateritium]